MQKREQNLATVQCSNSSRRRNCRSCTVLVTDWLKTMLEKCLQTIKLLMNWLKILYNQYMIFLFSYVNKLLSPFRYILRTKVTSAGVWPAIAKGCGPICCHHQSSTNGRSQWEGAVGSGCMLLRCRLEESSLSSRPVSGGAI